MRACSRRLHAAQFLRDSTVEQLGSTERSTLQVSTRVVSISKIPSPCGDSTLVQLGTTVFPRTLASLNFTFSSGTCQASSRVHNHSSVSTERQQESGRFEVEKFASHFTDSTCKKSARPPSNDASSTRNETVRVDSRQLADATAGHLKKSGRVRRDPRDRRSFTRAEETHSRVKRDNEARQ